MTTMREFMHSGLAYDEGVTEEDVYPVQLARGIEVEMEHTNDPIIARKIAMDHLAEHPLYYTALDAMEKMLDDIKG